MIGRKEREETLVNWRNERRKMEGKIESYVWNTNSDRSVEESVREMGMRKERQGEGRKERMTELMMENSRKK